MLNRLKHYYRRLPHYFAHQRPPWLSALLTPWFYRQSVPHRQDAPVIILTMGKVGSVSLLQSLLNADVLFIKQTHNFHNTTRYYPYRELSFARNNRAEIFMQWTYFPWLLRRPRVRVITAVREPIGRLISLYLFSYSMRFGDKLKDTSLQTLLDHFPRLFEQDYEHPLVPGYFLSNQIKTLLNIDVYEHPSPQLDGTIAIEEGRFLLFVIKLEIPDEQKAAALSAWMGRPIYIGRKNTAKDEGYDHIYEEFKRRVRIPYRYAEAMYQSSYMKHFYTPEERAKFWQRWEPQLDKSIPLPDWVEDQLQKYHPPIDELPQKAPL